MTNDAKIKIAGYVCEPLIIEGLLMLVVGTCLKIYRSLNRQAYPSQPNWSEPEQLCVIGFFVFVLALIAKILIDPY